MVFEFPSTQAEFETAFKDELSCMEYVISVRWPGGPRCSACQNDKLWRLKDGKILECSACGLQTRPLAGTIFQDTHLPMMVWLRIMWHVMSQKLGANATGLARTLDMSYPTAWNILHKLRRTMVRGDRELLGPAVEVDESFFGGHEEGAPGRVAKDKALVAVAVELAPDLRTMGRCRLETIPDASGASLIPFIQRVAVPGVTVVTDGWSGYLPLKAAGFTHLVKVQNKPDAMLKHAHLFFSLVKRWLLGTLQGGVSHDHLDSYLDEYVFRFNRRRSGSRGKLFRRLMEQAVVTPPITREELRAHMKSQP